MFTLIRVCLLLALTSGPSLFGADFAMRVNDKVTSIHKVSACSLRQHVPSCFRRPKEHGHGDDFHGQRIATNGDVRLMPTPEQWDLVATLKGRQADKANNRLTANLAFPTFDLSYTLEVARNRRRQGHHQSRQPLPQKLAGRAGFNLEFLPSIYMGKAYLVDGTKPASSPERLTIRWSGVAAAG